MNTVGRRIAERRNQKRLTQEDLGHLLNISQKQVSRYENGVNKPTVSVLIAFARALDTTPNYLLGFTNNPAGGIDVADLNNEEVELLSAFRTKDEQERHKIVEIVKLF